MSRFETKERFRSILGPKPEAILRDLEKLCHRDMPLEGEAPPDSRTVKSVIQELQTLKLEVLATLPRRIWQLRGDYHTIRAELENLVAGGTLEDLPSVAGKLKIQLRAPSPETVLIDDFGGPGKHRIHLKQDTIKVIQENLGYGISMFKAIRGSSSAGSGEINLEVSTYGDLKLRCLVKGKDYSLSKKLISSLSETAQQNSISGRSVAASIWESALKFTGKSIPRHAIRLVSQYTSLGLGFSQS